MVKPLKHLLVVSLAIVVLVAAIGCLDSNQSHQSEMSSGISSAIAVLHPTEGNNVSGTITFTQVEGGIEVVADVSGLS